MNEFIVWDKQDKEFREDYLVSGDLDLSYIGTDVSNYRCTVHQYIGKKDINNKKIYADCSIVEFWFDNGKERVFLKGYFTYNDIDLRYEVDILGDSKYVYLDYVHEYFTCFRIVDTIQKNKLGLIK